MILGEGGGNVLIPWHVWHGLDLSESLSLLPIEPLTSLSRRGRKKTMPWPNLDTPVTETGEGEGNGK